MFSSDSVVCLFVYYNHCGFVYVFVVVVVVAMVLACGAYSYLSSC